MTTYSGYKFGSGLKGSKITVVGKDNSTFMFDDVQSALDAAQVDDVIYFEPGTYTVTTQIDWSKPLTLMGMGAAEDVIIASALATSTVLINMPATGTATTQFYKARNIKFYNTSTGDAVEIDNDGGLAEAMNIDFQNCSFFSVSGVSIDIDNTDVSEELYITIAGNPFLHYIDGATTFTLDNADSYLNIFGMECRDAFAFGTATKAFVFNMSHCHYQSQAQTTGGGAGQLHNFMGNTYYTEDNSRSAATGGGAGDFDATATEFFNGHAVTLT